MPKYKISAHLIRLMGHQLELRLQTLIDKKRLMQSRNSLASRNSANFITLQEGLQQFSNELSKLQVRLL